MEFQVYDCVYTLKSKQIYEAVNVEKKFLL